MDEVGDVLGVECFCYFCGRDGKGTCTVDCQWSNPIKHGFCCSMWTPPDKWGTDQDYINKKIEEYERVTGKIVSVVGMEELQEG